MSSASRFRVFWGSERCGSAEEFMAFRTLGGSYGKGSGVENIGLFTYKIGAGPCLLGQREGWSEGSAGFMEPIF